MGKVQIGLYTEQQGEEQISAEKQDTNYLRQKIFTRKWDICSGLLIVYFNSSHTTGIIHYG